ncbi:hypothetical protein [Enterocloster sp.]|uniref:hypothetical protein n=1 Tax=Enterocloster sp. TaxID=2719315 RepID=UPI0039A31E73
MTERAEPSQEERAPGPEPGDTDGISDLLSLDPRHTAADSVEEPMIVHKTPATAGNARKGP